jgi:molybdopterin-binding protein
VLSSKPFARWNTPISARSKVKAIVTNIEEGEVKIKRALKDLAGQSITSLTVTSEAISNPSAPSTEISVYSQGLGTQDCNLIKWFKGRPVAAPLRWMFLCHFLPADAVCDSDYN